MNYQKKLEEIISNIKEGEVPKLLLHACCAPCSSYCIEYLANYFDITIYYYNPNIDTEEEFNKRSNEIKKFISKFETKHPVECVIEYYDNSEFEEIAKGYEDEKEGSARCFKCYRQRMEKAAVYAKKHDFEFFTTTLSISPYKNSNKINEIGKELEKEIDIKYLYADFKKKNGYKRSIELSKEYDLYRQDYCGCKYSKIERDKKNLEKIKEDEAEIKKEQPEISTEKITEPQQENKVATLYNASYNKDKIKKTKKNFDPELFKFEDIKRRDLSKSRKTKLITGLAKTAFIVFFLILGIYHITKYLDVDVVDVKVNASVPTEEEKAILSELYIYGNHMNLSGNILSDKENITDINLLMKGSSNTVEYDLIYDISADGNISFNIADSLNTGFLLDNMIIDNYVWFIKVQDSENKFYYYALDNQSGYDETTYYSISDDNISKKMIIEDESKYGTLEMKISKSTDEVYDIIIDPGHGGDDPGACYNKVCETDYTLMLSKLLKEDLEDKGFKVALTRNQDDYLTQYGTNGRVTIAHESHAKMLISIHLNSSNLVMNGFEIYTSNNLDYTFARNVVSALDKVSDFTYSYNPYKKQENGIYTRTFSSIDLNNLSEESKEKNYEPFSVSLATNYYFMIRETGGYMTGAYSDGRDGELANPYVNTNVGIESYILELGYITSRTDLDYIDKYKEDFMEVLSVEIKNNFNK